MKTSNGTINSNNKEMNAEDIFEKYGKQKEKKYSYYTSEIDERGMNYMNWFKLRHNTINQIDKIGINGLFTLLALIAHPHTQKKEHLTSTLKMINKYTEFKDIRDLKYAITQLVEHKFIVTKDYDKELKQNDIFEIVILYNNDNLYEDGSKGFKPIPIDYVSRRLLALTPLQCAIVCVLITYNRILNRGSHGSATGEMIYYCNELNYAFPNLSQISELVGKDRSVVKKNIELLAKGKLISYTSSSQDPFVKYNGNNSTTIVNPNYRYRVQLLQRVEYLYYLIVGFDKYDCRSDEEKKYIRENIKEIMGTDKQNIIKDVDYILARHNFSSLEKAIENKDAGFYSDRGIDKVVIDNFNNKDIESKVKKEEE